MIPKVGLALGGGAARGLAHLGVLKVLEDAKIPIHIITGTSLGALVVVRLKSKTLPAKESFEASKEQIVEELSSAKQDDALKRWVFQRCEALRAEGKIQISDHVANIPIYQGEGDNKKKTIFKYVPCQNLPRFGTSGSQFNLQ